MTSSDLGVAAAKAKRPPVRAALRSVVLIFGLGFLCAALLSIAVAPSVALSRMIAMALAQTPLARSTISVVLLGIIQGAICFAVFSLLPLLLELSGSIIVCASIFAAALPSLVLLIVQGFPSLLPVPVLLGRIAGLALSGLGGYASLRWRSRRAQKA